MWPRSLLSLVDVSTRIPCIARIPLLMENRALLRPGSSASYHSPPCTYISIERTLHTHLPIMSRPQLCHSLDAIHYIAFPLVHSLSPPIIHPTRTPVHLPPLSCCSAPSLPSLIAPLPLVPTRLLLSAYVPYVTHGPVSPITTSIDGRPLSPHYTRRAMPSTYRMAIFWISPTPTHLVSL